MEIVNQVNEEKNSGGAGALSPRPAPDSFAIYTAAAQAFGVALQEYTDGIVRSCREESAAFCDAVSRDWQSTATHEGMVKAGAVEYVANHLRQTSPTSRLIDEREFHAELRRGLWNVPPPDDEDNDS